MMTPGTGKKEVEENVIYKFIKKFQLQVLNYSQFKNDFMISDELLSTVMFQTISQLSSSEIFIKEDELKDSQSFIHSKRSSKFIEILHDVFVQSLPEDLHIFSKTKKSTHFSRSEFLFDVTVVKMKTCKSAFTNNQVKVITDAILLVESEFALDLNQTMIDFSKLLCGLAPVKMMIMPLYRNDQTINEWLEKNIFTYEMRSRDNAIYYLCYLKHPKDWAPNKPATYELYKCEKSKIVPIHNSRLMK